MFRFVSRIVVCCGSSLLLVSSVAAQTPTVKVHVSKRGALLDNSAPGGAGDARAFSVYLEANKSYECAVYGNSTSSDGTDPAAQIDISNITDGTSNTIFVSERGNASPPVNGFADNTVRNRSRVTLTPESSGRYTFPFMIDPDTNGNWTSGTGALSMWIDCSETTLYGGFNTFVNNFNFLELTNISNVTVTGKITATDFNGNPLIDNVPFTVGAGLRQDIDLHTIVGASRYGTVVVTHDASAGSLLGYVSQYNGTPTNFRLSVSLPLSARQ